MFRVGAKTLVWSGNLKHRYTLFWPYSNSESHPTGNDRLPEIVLFESVHNDDGRMTETHYSISPLCEYSMNRTE